MDETEKTNDQETTGASKPRPWWKRFISLFLKHLLPLLILGFLCACLAFEYWGIGSPVLRGVPDFQRLIPITSIFMAILVLVLPLATRGSLESLTCLLLAVEGGDFVSCLRPFMVGCLDKGGIVAIAGCRGSALLADIPAYPQSQFQYLVSAHGTPDTHVLCVTNLFPLHILRGIISTVIESANKLNTVGWDR